jgi:hypothetical protein
MRRVEVRLGRAEFSELASGVWIRQCELFSIVDGDQEVIDH